MLCLAPGTWRVLGTQTNLTWCVWGQTSCHNSVQCRIPSLTNFWGSCFLGAEGAQQLLPAQLPVLRAAARPRCWADVRDQVSWTGKR